MTAPFAHTLTIVSKEKAVHDCKTFFVRVLCGDTTATLPSTTHRSTLAFDLEWLATNGSSTMVVHWLNG